MSVIFKNAMSYQNFSINFLSKFGFTDWVFSVHYWSGRGVVCSVHVAGNNIYAPDYSITYILLIFSVAKD